MKFTLMNKDREIAAFKTYRNQYGSVRINNIRIFEPEMMPAAYHGDMLQFVNGRKAPKHRKYVQSILQQLGAEDVEGFIRVSNAASLTDTFWIRDDERPKTWDQVSLYRNDFDENIARIAFEGGQAPLTTTTPELSVDGNYAKCWIKDSDGLYLLKRGSDTYEREVFAEYYASQLADSLCTHAVCYDLVTYHEHLASKCKIFTSEGFGFSQMMHYVENPYDVTVQEALAIIEKYADGDDFRRMMVLDALILNIDRHLGNFGFLLDNDTQQPVSMAPVLDHNRSMLFNLNDERFLEQNMDGLIDLYPRLTGEFNLNANEMLTDAIKNDLRNLEGFTFKRHSQYNWPEKRLKKYESFLNTQINKILGRKKLFISKFE